MAQGEDLEREADVDDAAKRLERAVAFLEARVGELSKRAEDGAGGAFDHDRSKLAAELDAARAREHDLQTAGDAASLALDRAIADVRAALDLAEGA